MSDDGRRDAPPTADAAQRKMRLDLDADTAKGRYANGAVVSHGRHEVVLDFVAALPHHRPQVVSRIVLPRAQAEALARSLQRTLATADGAAAGRAPRADVDGDDDPN